MEMCEPWQFKILNLYTLICKWYQGINVELELLYVNIIVLMK